METIAPPLVVASTAPYSAMLIMMKAETLPWPARSLAYCLFKPKITKRKTGMITAKIRACRLLTRWFGFGRERYALRCCVCGEVGQGGELGCRGLDGVAGPC